MTIAEKLIKSLKEHGTSQDQAEKIMEVAIPQLNELVKDYHINFNNCESEYPEVIHKILFQSLKPIAYKWIEENKPQAWFKEMFI